MNRREFLGAMTANATMRSEGPRLYRLVTGTPVCVLHGPAVLVLQAIAAADLPQMAVILAEPEQSPGADRAATLLVGKDPVTYKVPRAVFELRSYRGGTALDGASLWQAGIRAILRTPPPTGPLRNYLIAFESLAERAETWRRLDGTRSGAQRRATAEVCGITLFRAVR